MSWVEWVYLVEFLSYLGWDYLKDNEAQKLEFEPYRIVEKEYIGKCLGGEKIFGILYLGLSLIVKVFGSMRALDWEMSLKFESES